MNNIQEEIKEQVNIGFTKTEIEQNLLSKGYDPQEIKKALSETRIVSSDESGGGVSTKNILLGLLFVVIVIVRIGRFASSGGNILLGISVITGIIIAIMFFTRRS